jgi:hypothetical protein
MKAFRMNDQTDLLLASKNDKIDDNDKKPRYFYFIIDQKNTA